MGCFAVRWGAECRGVSRLSSIFTIINEASDFVIYANEVNLMIQFGIRFPSSWNGRMVRACVCVEWLRICVPYVWLWIFAKLFAFRLFALCCLSKFSFDFRNDNKHTKAIRVLPERRWNIIDLPENEANCWKMINQNEWWWPETTIHMDMLCCCLLCLRENGTLKPK